MFTNIFVPIILGLLRVERRKGVQREKQSAILVPLIVYPTTYTQLLQRICFSLFSHCCDKVADKNKLKKERFILTLGFKRNAVYCGREVTGTGTLKVVHLQSGRIEQT